MSREERVIRPYSGLERIQRAVRDTWLRVGDSHVESGSTLILPPETYLSAQVALGFARDDDSLEWMRKALRLGLEEAEVEPAHADLLLVLTTRRLKLAVITWRMSCTLLDDLEQFYSIA